MKKITGNYVTKSEFHAAMNGIDDRFEKVDERFDRLEIKLKEAVVDMRELINEWGELMTNRFVTKKEFYASKG